MRVSFLLLFLSTFARAEDAFPVERIIQEIAASPAICRLAEKTSSAVSAEQLAALADPRSGVVSSAKAREILERTGWDMDRLLLNLIPVAKKLARPVISNFYVGAVGLGKSGTIYLGGNLEFSLSLTQFVHAEQSVVANAKASGESGLAALAVSAEPCGYCRQFLHELGDDEALKILLPNRPPMSLAYLLPAPFGRGKDLLAAQESRLTLLNALAPALAQEALAAANSSHSKYSPSGVAIKTADGRVYKGGLLQVSGPNPSLSALQAALVALAADGRDYADIQEVALVELENDRMSQEPLSRALLASIAPNARLTVEKARR